MLGMTRERPDDLPDDEIEDEEDALPAPPLDLGETAHRKDLVVEALEAFLKR